MDARGRWDGNFPAFAIGTPGIPPDDPPFFPPSEPAVPAKLLAEHWAHDSRLRRGRLVPAAETAYDEAWRAWRDLVWRLCDAWWPQRYYPLWARPRSHPARRFVAACLLRTPLHADEQWIASPVLGAQPLPATIEEVRSPADVVFWRAQFEAVIRRLSDAARDGRIVTTAFVDELAYDAFEVGVEAEQALRAELRQRGMPSDLYPGSHWCVPVFPGMTYDDWRDCEAQVMDHLRMIFGDRPLREEARRLRDGGMSVRAIAGLLGVSRPTVDHWLRGA